MTSFNSNGHTAKPRERGSKSSVKPILKRLTQSEKNSLDLDRSAAEQGKGQARIEDGLGIEYGSGSGSGFGVGFGSNGGGGGGGGGGGSGPGASRASIDVHTRRGYHYHHRSTSGTSQFSTATTGSGQGNRTGSFIHPFQQTPRPYTPPIGTQGSYQGSWRESELENSNSPALTEDEDQIQNQAQYQTQTQIYSFRSPSNLSNHPHTSPPSTTGLSSSSPPNISHSHSHSQHSQHQQHPLRITTSKQSSSSRLALATSHTSLHNATLSSDLTYPLSPTDSTAMSPASAIRSSLDTGFRIRSRSEVTEPKMVRSETIQEARRKFQEKEEAKEEKAAREEIRALEKRQMKEARMIERGHRRSTASNDTHTRSKRSKSDLTSTMQEKDGFVGRGYSEVTQQQTPTFATVVGGGGVGDGEYAERRSGTAKLKTHSAWTKFVMWIRTRFIRMGKKN
ncbi:uncharacterized protein RSE6_07195 [Rhynchosporium secalis]|uniref:Uncharacterized protein n=1 Tax=Rhynchosporium secalis TaxID=38038 RepID=A0A1E1MC86_RHYSE|nr:uncharacterized protein RSE6_07195 [Rhynchosporium secalis]